MPTLETAHFTVWADLAAAVVAEHPAVVAALGAAAPGLERAYLGRSEEGNWMHVLVWADRASALAAAQLAPSVPVALAWSRKLREVRMEHHDVLDAR